jgi:hypothetical protein
VIEAEEGGRAVLGKQASLRRVISGVEGNRKEANIRPYQASSIFPHSWENPNPSNKCVTQLGTPITVTSIDIPLILVKDKSNTREASRVTLGGLQGEKQGARRTPL